jgi:hypothetical protein
MLIRVSKRMPSDRIAGSEELPKPQPPDANCGVSAIYISEDDMNL